MFAHRSLETVAEECPRQLSVVGRQSSGQPRTYRLAPSSSQRTAYRRLALAILGLDVATLGEQLRSTRKASLAQVA